MYSREILRCLKLDFCWYAVMQHFGQIILRYWLNQKEIFYSGCKTALCLSKILCLNIWRFLFSEYIIGFSNVYLFSQPVHRNSQRCRAPRRPTGTLHTPQGTGCDTAAWYSESFPCRAEHLQVVMLQCKHTH